MGGPKLHVKILERCLLRPGAGNKYYELPLKKFANSSTMLNNFPLREVNDIKYAKCMNI
jgi:hypothetical protein